MPHCKHKCSLKNYVKKKIYKLEKRLRRCLYGIKEQRTRANAIIPTFDLTPMEGIEPGGKLGIPRTPIHQVLNGHDPLAKKAMHFSAHVDYAIAENGPRIPAPPAPSTSPTSSILTRKRKNSAFSVAGTIGDENTDDTRSTRTFPDKKQNHSEIEKRRRDKMNMYISELSSLVPLCSAMSRKLDKLTVLRMAVQHMRAVKGADLASQISSRPRPACLSERQLNALVLKIASDSFVLVVGCDRGRLLFVSTSVKNILQYEQKEVLGQSLFDILHPKDVAKVKEQLSSLEPSPRDRLIDPKNVVADAALLSPGARRSFIYRIKNKPMPAGSESPPVKKEGDPITKPRKKLHEKKYSVIQCTGYLKPWAPASVAEGVSLEEGEACNNTCLVAVCRILPEILPKPTGIPSRPLEFTSRHTTDGKFLFVDQRVTLALGYLPQELMGTSLYEYVNQSDMTVVASTHKSALLGQKSLHTPVYSFRKKDGSPAFIQTHFKRFKNPWTKDIECLVANNTVITDLPAAERETASTSYDMFKQKADREMQRLIDSQVESHKIGSAIAEEALQQSANEFSPELSADLLQDADFNQQSFVVENILDMDGTNFSDVSGNVPQNAAGGSSSSPPAAEDSQPAGSPPASPPLGADGNGEAAMSVIMSLLEADAGLGGAINFGGLTWPLP